MDIITDVEVAPLHDAKFVKPYRVNYTQVRPWNFIMKTL